MSGSDDQRDYEVGYGRPPLATRFKKGQSGNPRGRPRTRKIIAGEAGYGRLGEVLVAEAYSMVTVREGSRTIRLTKTEAVARAMLLQAMKGSRLHARLYLDMLDRLEREGSAARLMHVQQALALKLDWSEACRKASHAGKPMPDAAIPHPDDFDVNLDTGLVTVRGPRTEAEQKLLEERVSRRDQLLALLHAERNRQDAEPGAAGAAETILRLEELVSRADQQLPKRLRHAP